MAAEIRLTPELMPLVGAVTARPKIAVPHAPDESRDTLTEAVDAVSWAEWIAGDPRLAATGQVDECGCATWHWHTAENSKSATLHDGCERGYGTHVWSGTMRADLGIGEHVSRLQLAAALHGCSEAEAAAQVGVELRRSNGLRPITPDDLDDAAAEAEAAGDTERAARRRRAAQGMRDSIAQLLGTAPAPTYRVAGGGSAAAAANGSGGGGGDEPPDGGDSGGPDDGDGDSDSDGDTALAKAFAELPDPYELELEELVFDFLPETKAIREAARSGAVSPWAVLGITIGRGLLRVAPEVLLPPLVGNSPAPLNLQIGVVGASGKGKGVSAEIVDYRASVDEGWDRPFRPPSGAALANLYVQLSKDDAGEPFIEQIRDAAWCDWSEVDSLTATIKRGGNDLGSELRVGISGGTLGTDPKGERQHPLKVAARSYRLVVTVSVQYGEPASPLMAERDGGTLQRTVWVGTADPRRLRKRPRGATAWAQLDIMQQLPPGQQQLTVDEAIHDEVWEAQSANIESDCAGDELGGHHNLNRLKIAAWAALIQHRHHIGAAEWEWAGSVMEHSRRIQARLDASVSTLKARWAREDGRLDHVRRTAQSTAAAAAWEKTLASLARWAADPKKGPEHKKASGRFTVSDVMRSAKSGESRRINAAKLCSELVEGGVWGSDGTHFWVRDS